MYIVPFIPVRFYLNVNFLDRFSKNAEISNFMKNSFGGSGVVRSRRTYKQADSYDEVTVAFRNFTNAPNDRREPHEKRSALSIYNTY